ncbi:helix-turn-helix transcriptional regulator [Streptomyces sp. NPDC047973]|uniref:helix-turn-helix domain-containing protein n=1 Tax=Streptomyces sp. NPDC047973 TaxID=3155383 RepID=UPI003437CA0F
MSPSSGIPQFRAERLRTKREARSWSCEQLAVMAGITAGTIRNAEAGTSRPSPRVVRALAAALGCPVDELAPLQGAVTLRGLRARQGLTQRDVGMAVGVSTGMVSKVENGRHGVKSVSRWAAVYGVSIRRWTAAWETSREMQRERIRARRSPDRGTQ